MSARALVLLALAGCNTEIDPCAAFAGKTCLAVRARGPMQIDQVELQGVIGVEIAAPARTPPVAAGAFDLPAVTAVDLGNFEGAFVIRVRGLRDSIEVGAGLVAGDLTRGQHKRVDVDLRASDDGGVLDAAMPDLGAADLARPDAAIDGGSDDGGAPSEWRIARDDLPGDLYGIWGATPDDLFVVGETYDNKGLVLRGSDTNWSSEVYDLYRFNAVWGSARDNVYIASQEGKLWRFDGVEWRGGTVLGGPLYSVFGTDDLAIFAAGAQQIVRLKLPRSNQWEQAFVMEANWVNVFYGVWLAPNQPVFATGFRYMPPSSGTGSTRRFVGGNWDILDSPTERMNGVWGTQASNVYAVGAGGRIKHLVGNTWTTESAAFPVDLYAVWGSSAGEVYAVGEGGNVLHRDASGQWLFERTPVFTRLNAVFGIGGAVYAVGAAGIILRRL